MNNKSFNPYLHYFIYSRFQPIRDLAWRFFKPETHRFLPSDSSTRILLGGDVSLDLEIRDIWLLGVYRLKERKPKHPVLVKIRRKLWSGFCRLFLSPRLVSNKISGPFPELLIKKPENEKKRGFLSDYYQKAIRFHIDRSGETSNFHYPFEKIGPFMKEKDIVLVNLETPLSSNPRVQGFFNSDPRYAQAMKDAGITIVSLANNHIFDAGEMGFIETIEHLNNAGIAHTGAGMNLEEARLGKSVRIKGLKYIFLNYTQFCIHRYTSIAGKYPGVLPLDRELMLEDVRLSRKKADFVFICLHWGFEDQPNVHPKQIEIAHSLIDAGADGIIGHHPHVPHGIEIYKKRPILYSLGNFIFGQSSSEWRSADNHLAEIIIDGKVIKGVLLHPISGQGQELFQPELLSGIRANSLLHELQIKSAAFNTGIAIQNHVGYIKIQ